MFLNPEAPQSDFGDSVYKFSQTVNNLDIFEKMMKNNAYNDYLRKYTQIAAYTLFGFTGFMVIIFMVCVDPKESRNKTLAKGRSIISVARTQKSLREFDNNEILINNIQNDTFDEDSDGSLMDSLNSSELDNSNFGKLEKVT